MATATQHSMVTAHDGLHKSVLVQLLNLGGKVSSTDGGVPGRRDFQCIAVDEVLDVFNSLENSIAQLVQGVDATLLD